MQQTQHLQPRFDATDDTSELLLLLDQCGARTRQLGSVAADQAAMRPHSRSHLWWLMVKGRKSPQMQMDADGISRWGTWTLKTINANMFILGPLTH